MYIADGWKDYEVLDTNLTEALIEEGYVRETISKIQTMRRDADFDVTDRIRVSVKTGEKLAAVIDRNRADIMKGVLAVAIDLTDGPDGAAVQEWNINGETAVIGVKVEK